VPTQQFAAPELSGPITSYAVSNDDPFLLAYYVDDGPGALQAPLHVIRYDRATGDLRRGDVRDSDALPHGEMLSNCFGSVLRIREYIDTIYVETHVGPSAACAIVLSSGLSSQTVLPGLLEGFLGADYGILHLRPCETGIAKSLSMFHAAIPRAPNSPRMPERRLS
jgi:hypothetical protein